MKHPAIIRLIIVFFIFSFAADALAASYYCAKVTASVVDRGPTGTLVYGGTVMVQDRGMDQSYSTSSTGLNGNYKSIFVAGGDPVDITMKAKADNGYSFSGWFTSATATDAESTNATFTKGFATGTSTGEGNAEQHYMFAKFSPIPYDITYAKGDHGSGTSTTQAVNIESDITLLSGSLFTPNDGYEFKEWKVTSLGSTNKKWAMNQTYDSTNLHIGTGYYSNNVTLTAQWELKTYTITYDANGGSVSSDTQNYTINSTDPLLIPTRNGYTFAGWEVVDYDSDDGNWEEGIAESPLNNKYGDVGLQAKWTLNDYTITYAAGDHSTGGSTTATPYDIEHGFTLAANGFTPEAGWVFDKWKVTSPEGNWTLNSTYDEGQSIAAGKYGNVTMTALWKEAPYADIIISVSGLENGESAIFNVFKGGATAPLYTVALDSGNTSVTIKNQEIDSYTVTPAGWSWSYTLTPLTETTQTIASPSTTFSFSATRDTNAKKHDEQSNVNWRP